MKDIYMYKFRWFRRGCQMIAIGFFLFAASPSYAGYYGGYGHHYGYGYTHHGYYGHYSHHGHGSHLGYVLLGLTGIVLLSHLFNRDDYYPRQRHYNPVDPNRLIYVSFPVKLLPSLSPHLFTPIIMLRQMSYELFFGPVATDLSNQQSIIPKQATNKPTCGINKNTYNITNHIFGNPFPAITRCIVAKP